MPEIVSYNELLPGLIDDSGDDSLPGLIDDSDDDSLPCLIDDSDSGDDCDVTIRHVRRRLPWRSRVDPSNRYFQGVYVAGRTLWTIPFWSISF